MKPRSLRDLFRGFDYITLDPSPRLRELRESQRNPPETAPDGSRLCRFPGQPLPPIDESCYGPGSVPLAPSGEG